MRGGSDNHTMVRRSLRFIMSAIFTVIILLMLVGANGYVKDINEYRVLDITYNTVIIESYRPPKYESSLNCIDYELSDDAEYANGFLIDYQHLSKGQLLIENTTSEKALVSITYNDVSYVYNVQSQNVLEIIPLPMGAGIYEVIIGFPTDDHKIRVSYRNNIELPEINEYELFLKPNSLCYWDSTSDVVELVEEITKDSSTLYNQYRNIISWVQSNIEYDSSYADKTEVEIIYPDEILNNGAGVCAEFASLTASMLRIAGIPTKIVWGYTNGDYHAWNMCYINDEWIRVDTTYKNGNADSSVIQDNSTYTDYKYY